MSTSSSRKSSSHNREMLFGVAESIGAALGSLAAKASAAKKALTPGKPARKRVDRTKGATKTAVKALRRGSTKVRKTVRRAAAKTTRRAKNR
jgi:hypothetical protein